MLLWLVALAWPREGSITSCIEGRDIDLQKYRCFLFHATYTGIYSLFLVHEGVQTPMAQAPNQFHLPAQIVMLWHCQPLSKNSRNKKVAILYLLEKLKGLCNFWRGSTHAEKQKQKIVMVDVSCTYYSKANISRVCEYLRLQVEVSQRRPSIEMGRISFKA